MTQLSPTALEMVARAVFSARGWPDAIHPAFEHQQEDWEACATAAIAAYLAQAENEGWVMEQWHLTRAEAEVRANQMRLAKIASLKKQIAKLEKMTFTEPTDAGN